MRYLSLFSGMECAWQAWHPLGWECAAVAEIDPSACALLADRLPNVPNLGSVTNITDAQIAALGRIDVVIGGSPCQDLSVAGKRAGLAGARSSLFHEQLRIFHAARHFCGARWLVWENVPGAFSSNAGADFGAVVGALAGCEFATPNDGWGQEGVALGDAGLVEWCVLDAQWFGLAQRRKRVFAVLDIGDWANRPPVLLERDSLRGDSAPRRETGQDVAGTFSARPASGGGFGTDFECQGGLVPEISPALKARDAKGPSSDGDGDGDGAPLIPCVTHALRADGFDASEDGTGRGTPLLPVVLRGHSDYGDGMPCLRGQGGDCGGGSEALVPTYAIQAGATRANPASGPDGVGVQADCAYTLEARSEVQCVAFSCKDHAADAGDVSPTLRSMGHAGSHANAGGQVAVAIALRGREGGGTIEVGDECANALRASQGGGDKAHVFAAMAVRRLTPVECERLMGVPDNWTAATNARGKPMADGPRYRMIGNSFAMPCIRWIGQQIEAAHKVSTP